MDHRWYPVMAFHLYVSKGSLFMLESMPMLAKLRPFVCIFLKEASKMFEMYVYTMGEQFYALEMVKVLDPRTVYFSSSVISQADSTQRHQKGLDVVLGPKSAVLILDDTERSDESEPDGALATILKVLQQTQSTLFDPELSDNFSGRDVRQVLNRFGGKSRRDAR
ncbi:RNA polymerase II C-terminal domain phosphatase-like 4 isoform X6 [Vitis riparia]|uniref:RNA polymerase II C-terminal domain phosphatase-like 4 isoform X6 n=1 Tax=Vitis riparia TaxID=96939 RepID=UPI00155B3AD2|nr:RNA polymerase II C-terminal domain phosphatase-like 4 isoform X6 [Vitis riparia]